MSAPALPKAQHEAQPDRLGLALVAAAYAAVTGFLAWRLPLWQDEMYTLHTTASGPIEAARKAISFELQPPVYFVAEAFWREIFPGPLAARVPSVVFGVATVVVGAALARRLMPEVRSHWVALLIAVNPLVIWAGAEARCYALAILLGAAICLVFVRVHLDGWARGRPLLVALATLALYTQYYLGFLLAAAGVALIVLRRHRQVVWYAVEMGAVLVLFAPLVGAVRGQVRAVSADLPPVSLGEFLFAMETRLAEFSLGLDRFAQDAAWGRALRWGVRLALVAGILFAAWKQRHGRGSLRPFVSLAILGLAPLLIGGVVTGIAGAPWLPRHRAAFLVPVLLLPLSISRGIGPRVTTGTLLVLLASGAFASATEYGALAKPGDCRRVAQALERLENAGEPILVAPADLVMALGHYYRGRNHLVPLPREPSLKTHQPDALFPRSAAEVEAAIHAAGDPKAVWVYTFRNEDLRAMERLLSERWHEDRLLQFAGSRMPFNSETSLGHFTRALPAR